MAQKILKYSLLAGVAYFCCMAVAHFFGLKVPILFVYYDTPFYAYQDKIIAFAVVTYACLFFAGAQHGAVVPAVLVSIWVTVLGLGAVNVSQALQEVLSGRSTTPYWIQTALIAGYAIWLTIFYGRSRAQGAT